LVSISRSVRSLVSWIALIEAWASMKSFVPKDESNPPSERAAAHATPNAISMARSAGMTRIPRLPTPTPRLFRKGAGQGSGMKVIPSTLADAKSADGEVAYSYISFRLMERSTAPSFFAKTGLTWPKVQAGYATRAKRYGLRDQMERAQPDGDLGLRPCGGKIRAGAIQRPLGPRGLAKPEVLR
jgi:hypothetical protein